MFPFSRRIDVYDTSVSVFNLFLKYVYSGQLAEMSEMSVDQLSELLLLSDRYEMDALKSLCEELLVEKIDLETALSLLSVADQINATMLKVWKLENLTYLVIGFYGYFSLFSLVASNSFFLTQS